MSSINNSGFVLAQRARQARAARQSQLQRSREEKELAIQFFVCNFDFNISDAVRALQILDEEADSGSFVSSELYDAIYKLRREDARGRPDDLRNRLLAAIRSDREDARVSAVLFQDLQLLGFLV
eukprot:TRINITY_DN31186_c0_g1_i1.p1 TRINITY_DN31186_c0_g1~~TRINITY_DN31186_c0_g1_i1.p1  ORF type:complete len:124 (-),score=6.62 TRINITY_DN31186_c0_g1_i1:179-550(-)